MTARLSHAQNQNRSARWGQLHPFAALLLVAIAAGLVGGESPADVAESLEGGAGDILGDVGVTLALGAMLGRLLADSGATDKIAELVLRRSTAKTLPWLMAAAAFVIGIPMFFEVGLIVLLPLVFSVAQRLARQPGIARSPYTLLVVPTIAGLATLHGMVPPHPGPLIAVSGLHADLGKTILLGFACAVPTVVLAGPVFGRWLAPRLRIQPDQALIDQFTRTHAPGGGTAEVTADEVTADGDGSGAAKVPTGWAISAILVPVVLMLLRTLAETTLPTGSGLRAVLAMLGEPVVAMLAGFCYALGTLTIARGASGEATRRSLGESLKSIAGIVVAIGAGSIGLNYVNHGGFWLVKESFGMSMGTAAKTHTTVQTLVSLFGLGMAGLLWALV